VCSARLFAEQIGKRKRADPHNVFANSKPKSLTSKPLFQLQGSGSIFQNATLKNLHHFPPCNQKFFG